MSYNSFSLVYSQRYATIMTINLRTFLSPPKETPHHLAITYPNPSISASPKQPLIYFLSINICWFLKRNLECSVGRFLKDMS